MQINFTTPSSKDSEVLVVAALENNELPPATQEIDHAMKGALTRALKAFKFKGKRICSIVAPQGLEVDQLLVLGLGAPKDLMTVDLEEAGGRVAAYLSFTPFQTVRFHIPEINTAHHSDEEALALLANGFLLRHWSFAKYYTTKKPEEQCNLTTATFSTHNPTKAQEHFIPLEAVTKSVFLTRTVVTEPSNVINPETLAQEAEKLSSLGIQVEVYGSKELQTMGLHALLGVGKGSQYDSKLVVLQWQGASQNKAPIAVVGKGVTFDSGGISIKPSANMEDMKDDMAGSGVVLGLLQSLALRKAKVNVIGIMGLVENMPSGTAQKPGDVVRSLSGQTIEVINTDAEGRLVLADALWYTQERFKPVVMINIATLTGAIVVSLGHEYAGLFSNNDILAQQLLDASLAVNEKLWRLPLSEAYDKDINSEIADMKNVGSGRGAGSITAAQFLQRFVNELPWAHLDIAGTAWDKKDKPLSRKGATAFGVRLLNHFLIENYEKG